MVSREPVSDSISLLAEDDTDDRDHIEFVTRTSTSSAPSSPSKSRVFFSSELFELKLAAKMGLGMTSVALFGLAAVALRNALHRPSEAESELELTMVC